MPIESSSNSHDHTRGICHEIDMTGNEGKLITFEKFKINPLPCKCCGSELIPLDIMSESFSRMGMFEVKCPTCP